MEASFRLSEIQNLWLCQTKSPFQPCLLIYARLIFFSKFVVPNKISPDTSFRPAHFRKPAFNFPGKVNFGLAGSEAGIQSSVSLVGSTEPADHLTSTGQQFNCLCMQCASQLFSTISTRTPMFLLVQKLRTNLSPCSLDRSPRTV